MSASLQTMEQVRAYMAGDAFVNSLGVVLEELTKERCVCRLALTDRMKNGAGVTQGGVIFTLADYAGACLAVAQGAPAPTVNASITFAAAAPGGELVATATLLRAGRHLAHVRVEVACGGKPVAAYTATAFRMQEA